MVKNSQDCLNRLVGPSMSISGTIISTYSVGGVYSPTHDNGDGTQSVDLCVGACLTPDGTKGILWVHLQDDTQGTYFGLPLTPGGFSYASFDKVFTDRSNIALDSKLFIFPYTYKKVQNF
jgi:hypothetical protein